MTSSNACPRKQADKHSNENGKLEFNRLFGIVAHWQKGSQSVRKSELTSFQQTHFFPQWVFLNSWPGSCGHDQYQLSRVTKGKSRDVSVENVCTVLPVARVQSVYFYISFMGMFISRVCAAVWIKDLRQKQNTIVYLILQDHTPTGITNSQM